MIVDSVLIQHAENARSGWNNRSEAATRPDFNLADLTQLDRHITENLHGLSVAGSDVWTMLADSADAAAPASVFTAAAFAIRSGDPERISHVLEAVTDAASAAAFASAAAWVGGDVGNRLLQNLMLSDDPVQQHTGLAASAIQRHPFPGDVLKRADVTSQPRFLKGIGELGSSDLLSLCASQLDADDVHCRFHAAWAATLLGNAAATKVLVDIATSVPEYSQQACMLAARATQRSQTLDLLERFARNPDHLRLAVVVTGALGDPVLMPWLIQMMADPKLARVAGEAFCFITGIDLEYEDLTQEASNDAGAADDAAVENVADNPDEELPWPDPKLIQDWWKQNKGPFKDGRRYLAGLRINEDNLWTVLETGKQRQRAAAALEMALLSPGRPLFNVQAPGDRQLKLIRERRRC